MHTLSTAHIENLSYWELLTPSSSHNEYSILWVLPALLTRNTAHKEHCSQRHCSQGTLLTRNTAHKEHCSQGTLLTKTLLTRNNAHQYYSVWIVFCEHFSSGAENKSLFFLLFIYRFLFWTDIDPKNPRLMRSTLGGRRVMRLHQFRRTSSRRPMSLFIDYVQDRYFHLSLFLVIQYIWISFFLDCTEDFFFIFWKYIPSCVILSIAALFKPIRNKIIALFKK